MADEMDQAMLAQARQTLADWMNDKVGDDPELQTAQRDGLTAPEAQG